MSHKVSPVVTCFKPTSAITSPEWATLISSLLLACIKSILPIDSFLFEVEFKTLSLELIVPEYIRTNVKLPTNGSVIILNARALNGSLSSHFLESSVSSDKLIPLTLSTSFGDGK